MTHALFFYFILVYTIGLACLLLIISAYLRSRDRAVLAFVTYYLAFTLKVVMSGAVIYAARNLSSDVVLTALNRVDIYVTLFFGSSIVYLMEHFTGFVRLKYIEWGFYAAAVALLVIGAFPSGVFQSSAPAYLLLAAASLYSLVKSAFRLRAAGPGERGFPAIMVVGLATFIPLIFLPIFFESFFLSRFGHAPLQLVTFPLFYCANGVLFARHFHRTRARPPRHEGAPPLLAPGAYGLSDREIEVIRLVASGDSNRAIAEKLFISVPTVKKHLHNVFSKMGLKSRYQLIRFLRDQG